MRRAFAIAAVVVLTLGFCSQASGAEQEATLGGEVRGTFVRHFGQEVGKRIHLAVQVMPVEGKEPLTVLVPTWQKVEGTWVMKGDLVTMVLNLRKGQKLEIAWVPDGGQKWAKRIEAERLRDRPREGERRERAERERRDRPRREGEGERVERERRDRPREGERERGERDVRRRALEAENRELRHLVQNLGRQIEQIRKDLAELRAQVGRQKEQAK
jgi:hypothetical protein